jgi:hypothetical protein
MTGSANTDGLELDVTERLTEPVPVCTALVELLTWKLASPE